MRARYSTTTHQRPSQRFIEEKLLLINRAQPYVHVPAIQRKVSRDSMVNLAANRYSVPWIYVGHCVDLRISQGQLLISAKGTTIANHEILQGKHQLSIRQEHYDGLLHHSGKKQQRLPQHDPYWQEEIEVEKRDLSVYEKACLVSSQSFLRH